MVNVFIIDDNIYEANEIMTQINRISEDIRVIKLSTDINDAIRTLNNDEKIDIICGGMAAICAETAQGGRILPKRPCIKHPRLVQGLRHLPGRAQPRYPGRRCRFC